MSAAKKIQKGRKPESKPLAYTVDCILTSVSHDDLAWSMLKDEQFISTAKVKRQELEKLAVGDIGGVLLANAPLTSRQEKRFQELVRHWTGLTADQLGHCAAEAYSHKGQNFPGVVVVAMGADKKNTVLRALQKFYINHLVIDIELAAELEKNYLDPGLS